MDCKLSSPASSIHSKSPSPPSSISDVEMHFKEQVSDHKNSTNYNSTNYRSNNHKETEEAVLRLDSGFESDGETASLYEDCPEENDFSSVGGQSSIDSGHSDSDHHQIKHPSIIDNRKYPLPEPAENVVRILKLFFDNKLDEAMEAVSKRSDNCIHHSQAKMHFRFFYAMLTLDPVSYPKLID